VGQFGGGRSAGNADVLGADLDLAFVGCNRHGLAIDKGRPAHDRAHFRFLQQSADAARELFHDPVFPFDRLLEIDLGFWVTDAERVFLRMGGRCCKFVRGMDKGFRWNAAHVQASAAKGLAIDNDGIDAQLSGANGCYIAARTGANDQ